MNNTERMAVRHRTDQPSDHLETFSFEGNVSTASGATLLQQSACEISATAQIEHKMHNLTIFIRLNEVAHIRVARDSVQNLNFPRKLVEHELAFCHGIGNVDFFTCKVLLRPSVSDSIHLAILARCKELFEVVHVAYIGTREALKARTLYEPTHAASVYMWRNQCEPPCE